MYSAITLCPACQAKNRIPAAHLADQGRCGACKAALTPASQPINVTEAEFDALVAEARVPLLVDFWAAWCGPCRALAPELHALAGELSGRALVLKVDTEAEPGLANRFQIRSIPTLMVFRNGRAVAQRAGAAGRAELKRWLQGA